MAEFNAGAIEADLTLNRDPFTAGLQAAKREAAAFEADKIEAKVGADTSEADRKLADVEAEKAVVTKPAKVSLDSSDLSKTQKAAKDAAGKDGMGGLLSAAIALGPAAIPVLAAVTAGAIGLVPVLGAGALAVLGIVKAYKTGQLEGTAFDKNLTTLKTDLTGLENVAARNILGPLNQGMTDVHRLMPELTKDTGMWSGQLGQVVGHVVPGLITLLTRANPLFNTMGTYAVNGASAFQHWAQTSPAVSNFIAYAEIHLPLVISTLGNLVTVVSHVTMALAPWGTTVLTAINALSGALAHIPVGGLETIAPILAGLFVGNKLGNGIGGAESGLGKFITKLSGTAAEGGTAAKVLGTAGTVVSKLGVYGAIAGVALGGLSAIMGIGERHAISYQAQVDKVTQALQQGSTVQAAWVAAQNTGAAAATQFGFSVKQIAGNILGSQKDVKLFSDQLTTLRSQQSYLQLQLTKQSPGSPAYAAYDTQLNVVNKDIKSLTTSVTAAQKQYDAAKLKVQQWAASQGDASLATSILSGEAAKQATKFGATTDAYVAAKLAADKNEQSTKQNTLAMQIEGNAAGILQQALQGLGGQALNVAQAETSFNTAVNNATTSIKTNGTAIRGNSTAALANQSAIEAVVSAAQQQAQAVAQSSHSTQAAAKSYIGARDALLAQLAAHHELTPALQAYINRLFDVKNVGNYLNAHPVIPKVDSRKATFTLSALQSQITGLKGKTITLDVKTTSSGLMAYLTNVATGNNKRAAGSAFAAGGRIGGQGGRTADDRLIWASPGEFMVNAASAQMFAPLLEAINNIGRFAGGGSVPVTESIVGSTVLNQLFGGGIRLPLSSSAPPIGGGYSGASLGSHAALIAQALVLAGVGPSAANENAVNIIVSHESGWNPNAINLSDSNAAAGHPSQGLMQTIPGTFDAYRLFGAITDPLANLVAGIRYAVSRYGSLSNVPGVRSVESGGGYVGYDDGVWNVKGYHFARVAPGEMMLNASLAQEIRSAIGGGGRLHPEDIAALGRAFMRAMASLTLDGRKIADSTSVYQHIDSVKGARA